ncbi:DsbA family protein [Aureimonas ureilytica]|uniref:DsbA family protein n=1 Tax=Aureimonas ureilytica TaxID=401562 RepID=UPI0003700A24|nr:DsbA family protein [Aureimonas ureilytica]
MTFSRLAARSGLLALAGALAIGAASPALAFDDAQTRDIEGIVRNYLVTHPEVLIEAMQALESKRTAQEDAARRETIESSRKTLTATPEGTALGAASGDVTLVEFFDYNCGYCKRAASDMDVLMDSDPKLRVVLKEIPVLGPASEAASRVSLAFRSVKPESYGAFQRKLLASKTQVDEARALQVAESFGVKPEVLKPLLQGQAVQSELQETGALAMALGINGTPSYVVGDELVAGAVGADALAAKIGNVRQCGKATC